MNRIFRGPFHVTLAAIAGLAAPLAHAVPVPLVGGAFAPYEYYLQDLQEPFTAQDIANITDGDLGTGNEFNSMIGDFTNEEAPGALIGFGLRFDFDVSQFASVDSLLFSWTGLLTWEGTTIPSVRIGFSTDAVLGGLTFGTSSTPDNMVRTANLLFTATDECFCDVRQSINNGVASIWVSTDAGISVDPIGNNLRLQTFEVSADVNGNKPAVSVPEPAPMGLMALGLVGLLARRRRAVPLGSRSRGNS